MVYLDYSATTPVLDSVINSYSLACSKFIGNPNSLHKLGMESKKIIEESTCQISNILKLKNKEIIYTSGAVEANNLAIKGVCLKYKNRGNKIITTEFEHSSIYGAFSSLEKDGFEILFVKVLDDGRVDLEDLEKIIDNNTVLVSIASVNSELGIKQDLKKISDIVKNYKKCLFHSDVTQSIGKEIVDFNLLDLASFSAQKFYGMKGVGALVKNSNLVIEPLIHGGKSTTKYRSGTPAVALIVSMAKALRLVYEDFENKRNIVVLNNKYLLSKLKELNVFINSNENSIENIVNISFKNIKGEVMLHALEEDDIYVSTTTACSKGNFSKSIYSLYHDKIRAENSIRISISFLTTKKDIDVLVESLNKNILKLGSLIR